MAMQHQPVGEVDILAHGAFGKAAQSVRQVPRPIIPKNPTRNQFQPFDRVAYRARNATKWTFGRPKGRRRTHTRYDKLARNFASVVAAVIIGWCWMRLDSRRAASW